MKITFHSPARPQSGAIAVIVAEGEGLGGQAGELDAQLGGALSRAIKTADFTAKHAKVLEVLAPGNGDITRVVVCGLGKVAELDAGKCELAGGAIAGALMAAKVSSAMLLADRPSRCALSAAIVAARLGSGARLRNYRFDRYKTNKKDEKKQKLKSLKIATDEALEARRLYRPLDAVASGVHLARDLVNEPANTLTPGEFARRVKALTKLGVEVEILDEKAMRKLAMGALLGVAQGSRNPARLAVMRWNGGKTKDKPLAFIGKGVTFDTGGISIKPAAGMEDMKGDMGGAACVTGLLAALAARKAKVNAVGVIGLVENMPDGKAQRPGDIVTSMSGQTIAVLNTDAEGRLVLADCLHYARSRFKPRIMINLATLTGAILVALGKEHAGLFSNDDKLAERLFAAGQSTGEKVWRLPLDAAYDKLIDSDIADMKNIGGRYAGSITAAQFLKRFVGDTPWAHLDVAGTAMAAKKTPINPSWGSGWGVRLLDRLVAEHYE